MPRRTLLIQPATSHFAFVHLDVYRPTQHPCHHESPLCAMSNFVIAVAMDTLRSEQFRHRGCDSHFAQGANSFSHLRDPLRSEQFHFRGCDSHFAQGTISFSQLRDPLRSEQPHHRTCDSHFAPWGNPISHLQDHSHLAENQTISLCDLRMNSRPNNNTCDNLVATPQQ